MVFCGEAQVSNHTCRFAAGSTCTWAYACVNFLDLHIKFREGSLKGRVAKLPAGALCQERKQDNLRRIQAIGIRTITQTFSGHHGNKACSSSGKIKGFINWHFGQTMSLFLYIRIHLISFYRSYN